MIKMKFLGISILIMLISGLFISTVKIQMAFASNTIYIRADGTVDPPTAEISNMGNNLYVMTSNIADQIIIERDNAILDGAGFTLQNPEATALEEHFDQNPPSSNPLVEFRPEILPSSVGIRLSQASGVTIKNINIRGFSNSISIEQGSNNNQIFQNKLTSTKYPNWISANYLGLSVNHSTNNRIYGNYFSWVDNPVFLNYSSGNTIFQNTIVEYDEAIYLKESSNNIINQNTISGEEYSGFGIKLENSSFNVVSGNDVSSWLCGIHLSGDNNTFFENTIRDPSFQVVIFHNNGEYSKNNLFYHNNFLTVENPEGIGKLAFARQKDNSMNYFDKGYPSGGNYWSEYSGSDQFGGVNQDQSGSDGMIDTAFLFRENMCDKYPYLEKDGWVSSSLTVIPVGGGQDDVAMQSNAVISDVVATKNSIHCSVSGPSGQTAFVSVAVPVGANTTNLKVFVNNTKLTPPPFPIISSNGTHYIVYFELSLSTHDIEIEYAFSDWFILIVDWLPYIGLAVVIAVVAILYVIYRRRKKGV